VIGQLVRDQRLDEDLVDDDLVRVQRHPRHPTRSGNTARRRTVSAAFHAAQALVGTDALPTRRFAAE
jgi:hypothetical protein